MVERFLPPDKKIHLRGLFYPFVGTGDAIDPGGKPWVNTDERWTWLTEKAAKPARWLGYASFDRIIDERNAPAEIFVPDSSPVFASLDPGTVVEVPELAAALPAFACPDWIPRQRYRIILIGENVSLSTILRPIAEEAGTELLLMTGEISDTRVYEFAQRANEDGRSAVVFTFPTSTQPDTRCPLALAGSCRRCEICSIPSLASKFTPSP
jgi:hypothetical protein